ncbi:hypothetical protein [Aliivibrio fischeri]|uniref:hypothetical protein n=1 Tax=Aliivibrio fischeri TaxID=668 RepID=UPI001F2CFB5B|nr:hypothetical protein [Aliivibrio fischeri]MCE4937517.1 hypothetical protein [Aliivibrio fischeri]
MFKKYMLFIFILVFSSLVSATPKNIKDNQQYKDSLKLVKTIGRKRLIQGFVKMQMEQINDYGGSIDEYTEVIGIIGFDYGMSQTVKVKITKMLSDFNEILISKSKPTLIKNDIILYLNEGGELYNNQLVMFCSNPGIRGVIDSGVEYSSKFYDQKMKFISEVIANKSTCLLSDEITK